MAHDDGPSPDGEQPTISAGSLQHLIHHIFLPSKLPQKDDSTPENDLALTKQVLEALKAFEANGGHSQEYTSSASLIAMLKNMLQSRAPKGGLLQDTVEDQMGSMKSTGMSQVMQCHLNSLTKSDRYTCFPH
jgi:hypothetical protein